MNATRQDRRPEPGKRSAAAPLCPACCATVPTDAARCPACGFTGGDTMAMFPDAPPPLMPLFDAADLWHAENQRKIEIARIQLQRRFPQFRFHVWSVMLPAETSLPLFGFWLLNVCPFYVSETAEERSWAVLFLIDARNGRASIIPGYSAERWLGERVCARILRAASRSWQTLGGTAAPLRFFEASGRELDRVWRLRGLRGKGAPAS